MFQFLLTMIPLPIFTVYLPSVSRLRFPFGGAGLHAFKSQVLFRFLFSQWSQFPYSRLALKFLSTCTSQGVQQTNAKVFVFSRGNLGSPIFREVRYGSASPSSIVRRVSRTIRKVPGRIGLPIRLGACYLGDPLNQVSSYDLCFRKSHAPCSLYRFSNYPSQYLLSNDRGIFHCVFNGFVFTMVTSGPVRLPFLVAISCVANYATLSSIRSRIREEVMPVKGASLFVVRLVE